MKSRLLVGVVSLLAFNCSATTINFGNDSDFGLGSRHRVGFLLGSIITIDQTVDLLAAGIIFYSGGYNGNIGIYSSNAGEPDQLLATTGAFHVPGAGTLEVPFTSNVTLDVGDYWFMGVYDEISSIGIKQHTNAEYEYRSLNFTSELPTAFGTAITESEQEYNYYIKAAVIPIPSALYLFGSGSGLLGLVGIARRKKAAER